MSNQRVITVFTSKGKKQKITTDVTTWGNLKPLVEEHYDLNNLQATENIGKTTLMHVEAALPASDFVLFLRPIKTKSGSGFDTMSFQDLRASLTGADKAALQVTTGNNWTRVSKQNIIDQLNSRDSVSDVNDSSAMNPTNGDTVEEIVTESGAEILVPVTNLSRIKQVAKLLKKICKTSTDPEVCERVEVIQEDVAALKDLLQLDPAKEAAEKAEREEDERLNQEFNSLSGGF
jgi:hypothetical protein